MEFKASYAELAPVGVDEAVHGIDAVLSFELWGEPVRESGAVGPAGGYRRGCCSRRRKTRRRRRGLLKSGCCDERVDGN